MAGTQLVVLTDDKHLQQVDNVVPAINGTFAGNNPDIVSVVDTVSAALDTPTLVGLNKAVDVDRKTSSEVAAQFIKDNGLGSPAQVGNNAKVTVGAPNFSEGATLAAIYADALKAAGFDASAQTIGNRETYLPLLEKGDLTVVPEYLGTLATFLNKAQNGASADPVASGDLDATLTALRSLGANAGLVFGNPSTAQDQNAFAVTKAFADAHGITSLSELAADVRRGRDPRRPARVPPARVLRAWPGEDLRDPRHRVHLARRRRPADQGRAPAGQGRRRAGVLLRRVAGVELMIVAFSVAPLGSGESVSPAVADAVRVVRDSGLPYRLTSMFTELEGEWDECMDVVRRACERLAAHGSQGEPGTQGGHPRRPHRRAHRQDRAGGATAGRAELTGRWALRARRPPAAGARPR